MQTSKRYYATTEVPTVMLALIVAIVILGFTTTDIEVASTGLGGILFVLAVAPFIIWQRLRRPILTIEKDLLRINPSAGTREEHVIPFSKIVSISIKGIEQESLELFEYKWAHDCPAVDSIIIVVSDGRIVPPLPIEILRRRHRKEVQEWVRDVNTKINAGTLAKELPGVAVELADFSPLGVHIGEPRKTFLSRYADQVISTLRTSGDGSLLVTIGSVIQWNLDGFLVAEFDERDRLCAVAWQADPWNRITEPMIRRITDQLEVTFGPSEGKRGPIEWKRQEGDIVRQLSVKTVVDVGLKLDSPPSYGIRYFERSVDGEFEQAEELVQSSISMREYGLDAILS